MTKTMVAVLAVLSLSPAFADDLDPARARLAEIRANRAHATAPAAPAPAAEAAAPAPAASPAAKAVPTAEPRPGRPPGGTGYPMKYSGVDMRKPLGPGRPELKTSGSFQYYNAKPFGDIPWRVIIEEHAYQVGDIIRGARITKIDGAKVWFTKDGDSWSLPTFMH